jgi:transposase-like protein
MIRLSERKFYCPKCGGQDETTASDYRKPLKKIVIHTPDGKEKVYKCYDCVMTFTEEDLRQMKYATPDDFAMLE